MPYILTRIEMYGRCSAEEPTFFVSKISELQCRLY